MSPSDNAENHDLACLTIAELEAHAHTMMDKQTRDYYNEGADAGSTLRENISTYSKYRIRPRVLRDVSRINCEQEVFGWKSAMPVGVAPTAMQCLAHSDGEVGTVRACRAKGIPMGLSSFSTKTLEEVAKESKGEIPLVLQLYLFEDREESRRLIERAKKAGFKAVFLTVDTPFLGRRNLELRNKFSLPPHFKVANFAEDANMPSPTAANAKELGQSQEQTKQEANTSKSRSAAAPKNPSKGGYTNPSTGERHEPEGPVTFHTHAPNPTLSWESSIPWLKRVCGDDMQLWVKGVATAEDALLAYRHGCDGIVVSNHGGRQLDGALSTLDALPEVAAAVKGKIPVHVDGGVRHGTDVFKALALGAAFVWVGRPALWGLAYKGQAGVELMLRLLADEFRLCMALAGVVNVADVSSEYLVKVIEGGFTARL